MPAIQWDSSIEFSYRLTNLKEVILHNYRMVQGLEDADEYMVDVEFQFGEINHDYIPITNDEGMFLNYDRRPRDPDDFWLGGEAISFSLQYDEVEEFIEELKSQMEMLHYTGCKLIIR